MVSYVLKILLPLDFIGPLTCWEDGWRFIWFHSNAWLIYSLAAQCLLALCGPVRMLGEVGWWGRGADETFLCPGGILWGERCLFKGGQQGDNTRTAGKAIGNLIPWTLPSYSIPVLVPSPIKRPPPRQRKNGLIPRTSRTSQGSYTRRSLQLQKCRHPERKKYIYQKLSYITYVYSLEFHSSNPKPLSGSPPPPASEITASQPQSRDAVCLVIWWLIPCLFPTNLFPDKGVASTLVNMGASADCQTRALVEEMVDRGKTSSLPSTGKPLYVYV